MVYLFIGEDELPKQEKIRSLKKELFSPQVENFNYEALSAKDLTISLFRETLSRLPVASRKRMLVIKDVLRLKEGPQEYFISQIDKLPDYLVVVLDIAAIPREENLFLDRVLKVARVLRFNVPPAINAFGLRRAIEKRDANSALSILADLFKAGEKPERILGALRYQLINNQGFSINDKIKKAGLLLQTDLSIKTGKIRPEFSLEALIVRLCR